jgi:hypothetical protein
MRQVTYFWQSLWSNHNLLNFPHLKVVLVYQQQIKHMHRSFKEALQAQYHEKIKLKQNCIATSENVYCNILYTGHNFNLKYVV